MKQSLITSLLQLVSSMSYPILSLCTIYLRISPNLSKVYTYHHWQNVNSIVQSFLNFKINEKILWTYFIITFTPCQKNSDSFFKLALLLSGDIQLNPGPTSDVCFVYKRTLNKRSFYCSKCDLRAHKKCNNTDFLMVIYVVTVNDGRIYYSLIFLFVLIIVAIQNHIC